ncbi:MAG TPA: polysaccharide deacetylase family protein [Anaeromyxobacter sp.]|nr:polysaccharide deacetylase family protein [Anaeromyxobacter sp.]
MTAAAVAAAVVALGLLLQLELSLFTPLPRRALRVLMYHRVTLGPGERYAVPATVLRRQLAWLSRRGHRLVSLSELVRAVEGGTPLPDRAVLLTFDDGTVDALEVLRPLLLEAGARGAVFAVPGWAGTEQDLGGRRCRILDAAGLRVLAPALEVGLHGHLHRDLRALSPGEVEEELRRAAGWLAREGVPALPALAFPYGAYPRQDPARRAEFLEAVGRAGVRVAFRIGNRVNPLPLRSPLEVQRTEVRGDEPFWVFAWKVRTGRRRAF